MSWDPEILGQLYSAFDDSNIDEFKRLLRKHPDHLRNDVGLDFWMLKAAMAHKLPILQAMVELGLDVNESHDRSDESDPFYEPEGPILQAASGGDFEMVKWLLDHGARINYVVNGHPRCMPLIRASTEGHFEIVKLLVEHGADVHATWQGLNAAKQAKAYGHHQIRDYLLSLKKE